MIPTDTVKSGRIFLVVVWTRGNKSPESAKKKTTSATGNSRYMRVFVVEVVKLYFNEEVQIVGYRDIVCLIQLIGSRLLTEGQVACLGDVLLWETSG